MAVIRDHSAKDAARRARAIDLGDVQQLGEMIVAQARAKADALIAEAQRQHERLIKGTAEEARREGYAKGHAEGMAAGQTKGRAEALAQFKPVFEALGSAWEQAASSFDAARRASEESARHDVLQLACLIAERVIKRTLQLDPTAVNDQVAAALELILRPSRIHILVSPDDVPIVQEVLPGLASRIADASGVRLAGDAALARGSCIVKLEGELDSSCSRGEIDASIATQLDRIVRSLLPGGVQDLGAAADLAGTTDQTAPDGPIPGPHPPVPPLASGPKGLAA